MNAVSFVIEKEREGRYDFGFERGIKEKRESLPLYPDQLLNPRQRGGL